MKKYKDMTTEKLAETLNQMASAYRIIDENSETATILEEAAARLSAAIWPLEHVGAKDECS